jgi:YD repeat-containing protein
VKAVAASGQNHRYHYLHKLHYDKFEQRTFVEQGNGVKTAYAYNAQTRRLSGLTATRQGNMLFQNLQYSYDKVGNILGLQNVVDVPPPNVFGGPTNQSFVYDDLYRLTHAQGTFQYSPSKTHTYNLDLTYDTIHNIQRKNQLHQIVQPSTVAITQKKTTYDFTYAYAPSRPASVRPHAPTHIGERTFTYDANGNQTGWTHNQNGTRRNIVWDDENRIQSVFDSGHEKTYKYDDQGQRLIKRGPQGETVYVNQFFTDRPGANATKHVYAGTARIASKLIRPEDAVPLHGEGARRGDGAVLLRGAVLRPANVGVAKRGSDP